MKEVLQSATTKVVMMMSLFAKRYVSSQQWLWFASAPEGIDAGTCFACYELHNCLANSIQ